MVRKSEKNEVLDFFRSIFGSDINRLFAKDLGFERIRYSTYQHFLFFKFWILFSKVMIFSSKKMWMSKIFFWQKMWPISFWRIQKTCLSPDLNSSDLARSNDYLTTHIFCFNRKLQSFKVKNVEFSPKFPKSLTDEAFYQWKQKMPFLNRAPGDSNENFFSNV